jgi:hypothetical protein
MINKILAFLSNNSCSESSTLIVIILDLQSSRISLLLTSHKHNNKQTNKNN